VNTTLAAPAWKSYRIGTIVKLDDGRSFQIDQISVVHTDGGYNSRRFTLSGPGGKTVVKSSRGITLWVAGLENDRGEPTPAATPVAKPPVCALPAVGIRHANYTALLNALRSGNNVWLYGPPGTGKTTAGEQVAKDLGLKFYPVSCGPQTGEAKLTGYGDAQGRAVRTAIREAFEHGGLLLIDEIDAASPAVLVTINSVLANQFAGFHDGTIERHPDFKVIAGANTVGQGGGRKLVGRNQLDEASLDRFVVLLWQTDPAILAAQARVPAHTLRFLPKPAAVQFRPHADVEGSVQKYAELAARIVAAVGQIGDGIRLSAGGRCILNGVALVRDGGFGVEDALDACVWKYCDRDTRLKVEAVAQSLS
jgi:MoxR-like ATPase